MASYRESLSPVRICPYDQYECPGICCGVDSALMVISSATQDEHCRAAVNFEYCPIYECATREMVSDVWQ